MPNPNNETKNTSPVVKVHPFGDKLASKMMGVLNDSFPYQERLKMEHKALKGALKEYIKLEDGIETLKAKNKRLRAWKDGFNIENERLIGENINLVQQVNDLKEENYKKEGRLRIQHLLLEKRRLTKRYKQNIVEIDDHIKNCKE